jgi:hypothetical protein
MLFTQLSHLHSALSPSLRLLRNLGQHSRMFDFSAALQLLNNLALSSPLSLALVHSLSILYLNLRIVNIVKFTTISFILALIAIAAAVAALQNDQPSLEAYGARSTPKARNDASAIQGMPVTTSETFEISITPKTPSVAQVQSHKCDSSKSTTSRAST